MGIYATEPAASRGVVFEKRAVRFFRGGRRQDSLPRQTKSHASKGFHAVVLRTTAPGVPLYGYRHLSTELGRWVNRDPLGEMAFFRQYSARVTKRIRERLFLLSIDPVYLFALNSQIQIIDALGLASLIEFCKCKMKCDVSGRDCLKAWWMTGDAERQARNVTGESGSCWRNACDAVRHCIWSCEMQKAFGLTPTAKCIADNHEDNDSRQSPADRIMDDHNNQVGRDLASIMYTCEEGCTDALENGRLITGVITN